ncbi:unnamed protein product [Citrullus colocynthis]|uniref:Uncharacterized protein n=1 Tax=Citrullus colocynthis TaxID=252529 RepID=A0ABP0YIK0_9ROSI
MNYGHYVFPNHIIVICKYFKNFWLSVFYFILLSPCKLQILKTVVNVFGSGFLGISVNDLLVYQKVQQPNSSVINLHSSLSLSFSPLSTLNLNLFPLTALLLLLNHSYSVSLSFSFHSPTHFLLTTLPQSAPAELQFC